MIDGMLLPIATTFATTTLGGLVAFVSAKLERLKQSYKHELSDLDIQLSGDQP